MVFRRLRAGVPRKQRQPGRGTGAAGGAGAAWLPEEPPLHPAAAGRSRRTGDAEGP